MPRRSDEIEINIPHLRRFALALTRNPDMADDLVQDTVERALSRWYLCKPGLALRPWLFAILRNLHISGHRKRARMLVEAETEIENLESAAPAAEDRMELIQVLQMLGQLPEEQRAAILLVSVEGFSYAETARILNIPIGTLMSRLSRGRRKLRDMVDMPPEQQLRRVV